MNFNYFNPGWDYCLDLTVSHVKKVDRTLKKTNKQTRRQYNKKISHKVCSIMCVLRVPHRMGDDLTMCL